MSDPSERCFGQIDDSRIPDGVIWLSADLDDIDGLEAGVGRPDRESVRRRGTVALALEAIEVLESNLAGAPTVVHAHRLIGPMLELWDLADAVDPAVATPVEALLTHLVGREHTTIDEVAA
ncbi:MAG TPA: hypothetical protein VGR90_09075, partial [Acidimicrobiales bacterium]|nr:hypothetical protein [Acidimicrobiales bacterium]